MKTVSIVWVCFFLLATSSSAHDLWIAKEENAFIVARGHAPDRIDEYNPLCVKEVKGFDAHGKAVSLVGEPERHRYRFRADGSVSLISLQCDWGYRVTTTEGKKLMSREQAVHEGFRVINSFFSTQFLKAVVSGGEVVTTAVGMRLELVPLKNPFEISPGEKLPLRLLYEGNPLTDTDIVSHAGEAVKTNDSGIAAVTISNGKNDLFSARFIVPAEHRSDIDYHQCMTFLAIGVP